MHRPSLPGLLVLTAWLAVGCNPSPDEFGGTITYQTHLTAKRAFIDEAALNALYGDTLQWTYHHGSYRWAYNGTGIRHVTYPAGSDREYTRRHGSDTLYTSAIAEESRTLDSLYVTGETRTILGRTCEVLVKQIRNTRHTYCIDPTLALDPAHFAGFHFGFAAERHALLPGAYLAYTYESPVFRIDREALAIEEHPVSAEHFALPDLPQQANP